MKFLPDSLAHRLIKWKQDIDKLMEENNKEFVKKYISAYESLSINNLDNLKTHLPMINEFEDPFNKVNGKEEL